MNAKEREAFQGLERQIAIMEKLLKEKDTYIKQLEKINEMQDAQLKELTDMISDFLKRK